MQSSATALSISAFLSTPCGQPTSESVIQWSSCLEFFGCNMFCRCIWLNSRHGGLNEHPIIASIVYWRTRVNIQNWGQKESISCSAPDVFKITTKCQHPWYKYSSMECLPDCVQGGLKLHPPWLSIASLHNFAVIQLNFILHIPLHTCLSTFPKLLSSLHQHETYSFPGE